MNLETNYNNVDVCGKQIHVVQKQIYKTAFTVYERCSNCAFK